jgi:hypothetical protein
MIFRNYTPFPPMHFDSRDENQRDYGVLVLRGTFDFRNGSVAQLRELQDPIVWKDEYYGDPQKSSMKTEGCLTPFKPATDFVLTASAQSPSGRAEPKWTVAANVGGTSKSLVVTGPRKWQRRFGVLTLTEPEPVTEVPVRYELAYGGSKQDGKGEVQSWPENPAGRGFAGNDSLDGSLAPQIFENEQDVDRIAYGKAVNTAGFGPVAPHWAPRCNRVGSYNEMWKRTRFPDLPSDFEFDYFSTGSKGFVFKPFLKGNERIELTNLTKERRTVFALPGFQLATIMRFESGEIVPGPVMLDTVHVNAIQQTVHLTWRSVYPVDPPLRVLEVRVKASSEV